MLSESYKNRIKLLAGLMSEVKENHKNEYGCLMLNVKHPDWDSILSTINKEDLYEDEPGFGAEKEPHVTILFGFHKNVDIDKIKEMVKDQDLKSIKIKSKGISMFKGEDYDVIKFDIESEVLHDLNKLMTDNFDYTSDFPNYHPHMTIAYVKKGKGKKYIDKKSKNFTFTCNEFLYSTAESKKTKFKL